MVWDVSTGSYASAFFNPAELVTNMSVGAQGTKLWYRNILANIGTYIYDLPTWTNVTTTSSNVKGTTSGLTNDAA
ncbi:hypothetical protein LCGC14_3055820, partial [marine sediment metagenome]